MAWNKDNPVETEKIRLLSDVITANNTAIEQNDVTTLADSLSQWVIHLVDRSTIAGANDPARIDTIGMLYCKDDGAKNELFFRDSENPSNIIQLTNDGKIGFTSTAFEMDSFSFDGTRTFDEKNVVVAWGYVSSAGVFQYGEGIGQGGVSVTVSDTSLYSITFTTGVLTTTDYAVVAMATANVNAAHNSVKTTANFDIRTRSTTDGAKKASAFFFIVVGGQ